MRPDHVLNQMAKFDFTAPIDIQFFEEIEDENSSKKQNTDTILNDQDDNDVIYVTEQNKNNILSDDTGLSVENVNSNIEERVYSGKEINKNKHIPEKQTSKLKSLEQLVHTYHKPVEQDKECGHITKSLSQIDLIQNGNNNATGDTLDTVSKSLIAIMEAYCYYLNIKQNKQTTSFISELSMKRYLRIKYHYFNISRDIVISEILTRNRIFIHRFINNTISLIGSKNKKNKSIYIKAIFCEMIKWINVNKNPIHSRPDDNNPILRQQLNRPSLEPFQGIPSVNQPTPVDDNDGKTSSQSCIFTSGPPGREISINIAQNVLTNLNTSITANAHKQHTNKEDSIEKRSQHMINNFNFNPDQTNYISNQYQRDTCGNINKVLNQGLIPPNAHLMTYHNNSFMNTFNTNISNQTPNCSTVNTLIMNKRLNAVEVIRNGNMSNGNQNLPNIENDNVQRAAKRARHSSMYNDRRYLNTDNALENNNTIRNVQTAPPFEMAFLNHIQNHKQHNSNGFQHNVMPISSTTNNGNSSNSTSDIVAGILELEESTDRLYFKKGYCNVCEKITKVMCSGCFKVYYCTKECQVIDWISHKSICHT